MNAPDALPLLNPDTIVHVPIGMLHADPDQPRLEFDAAALKTLAADIAARGIELPIVVRSDYQIKDGERRWRAAKLAGLATVPCLLAAPMAERDGVIEWRLDQVADNHHREPLGALDWARVLRALVETHGVAVKDIPALLQKRGIEMSRSYVSNLIRLNELPEWAKALIARSVLPPAAGKYVLMASGYAPAMENLRRVLETRAKQLAPDQALRADLHWDVCEAFRETATRLDQSYGDDMPRFAWRTSCQACPNRSRVDDQHFCLDRTCYDRKQAETDAKARKSANGEGAPRVPAKRKPDPREAARKRQERARAAARDLALRRIVDKSQDGLNLHDRRLIARALVREMQHEALKTLFAARGWEPKKERFSHDYHIIADREIAKLNQGGLDGLLMECALRGALTVGFYRGNVDHLADTARRYRIDLKALEKAALAEIKKPKSATKTET